MPRGKTLNLTTASLFAALTACGSYVHIPAPIVPVTIQTFFVYLSGSILGPIWGVISQVLYLFLGVAGMPVFAGAKSGYTVLLGPTGGYLIGFVFCSLIVGCFTRLSDKFKSNRLRFACCLLSMVTGTLIIYFLGILQLCQWIGVDIFKAIEIGVLPFLPGDTIKIILASILTYRIRPLIPR